MFGIYLNVVESRAEGIARGGVKFSGPSLSKSVPNIVTVQGSGQGRSQEFDFGGIRFN